MSDDYIINFRFEIGRWSCQTKRHEKSFNFSLLVPSSLMSDEYIINSRLEKGRRSHFCQTNRHAEPFNVCLLVLSSLMSDDYIMEMGEPHNVSIRAIHPSPVYQLQKAAIIASKKLNFARPMVKGLVVCMRKTRTSPPTPIYSMEELNAFVEKHTPPPPSLPMPQPMQHE